MKKSLHRQVLPALILLFLAASLSAAGRREDPIRQARELVASNRINDAILLLERTIRDDPERIVEAEALMRGIREIRGEYNVLFELLIDNLVNNPDDITRTLQIIDQMERLDQFPNERVLRQVEDARVIAQLAFDRSYVNETMDRARVALDSGNYAVAIGEYRSLDTLQRPEFDNRGYGDIFVNRVNEAVARLESVSLAFTGQIDPYRSAAERLVAQATVDASTIPEAVFDPFVVEVESLLEILRQAETLYQDLAVLRSQVPLQFPDRPVDWYLNFREMITRGRSELRDQEGLLFAVRDLYEDFLRQIAQITGEQAGSALQTGLASLQDDRPTEAGQVFNRVTRIAWHMERAEAMLQGIVQNEPSLEDVATERFSLASAYHRGAESLEELARTIGPFVALGPDVQVPLETLLQRKETVRSVVNGTAAGRAEWVSQTELFETAAPGVVGNDAQLVLESVSSQRDDAYQQAVAGERVLAVRIAEIRTEPATPVIAMGYLELDSIEPLLEGIEEPLDEGAVRVVRYPDDALERIGTLDIILEESLAAVSAARESLQEDADHVVAGTDVQAEIERLSRLMEQLNLQISRTTLLTGRAEDLVADALAQRNQGLQRIAAARASIAALQLDAARNNWAEARDSFYDSLQLREDAQFRQQADSLIADLGREILELENVIVIQRVRELLTRAETQYSQDEYVAARDTLLQAQQTWEQTNVDRNSEIDRLLLLATAALNLEEGRELSPMDPLYPVLGNYLSLAREDFNRGIALFEAGNTAEANRFFDRSIENLRNVRDVRPLNWDSRILELRIVQLRDAAEFEEIFATRFNQAVSRLAQAGPLEVYSEIEVLAEINPAYPGIQQQLRRLEIMLNLRPDPIDQQRITRANQLYQQASNLAGGSRDQIVVAVSLLEDAVDLNPGNSNARFLLDQLRIRLGGQATAALSSTDEQQYRRAETLFQQGQVLQALAITERLLSNTANQGYPPLVELRRRIGLRLGI